MCTELNKSDSEQALTYLNRYFVPTNLNLEAILKAIGAEFWLNPRYLEGLYFLISYLMASYANEKVKRGHHANIESDLLKRRMRQSGGRYVYKDGIRVLEQLGIIHVNESYCHGQPDPAKNFCKSYALTRHYCGTEFYTVSFKVTKPFRAAAALSHYPQEHQNDVEAFVASNLSQLRLDESALESVLKLPDVKNDDSTKLLIERAADKIRAGKMSLRSGTNQNRIYHTVINAPREFRHAVTLNDGGELLETDIPSCQPVLLLSIMDGITQEEEKDYREVLQQDIYLTLGDGNRDRAKKEFLCFAFPHYSASGTSWEQFLELNQNNTFGRNFIARFPNIARKILFYEGSLSCDMQNLEANICVYSVVRQLKQMGVFAISLHDGFLIKPEDYYIVNAFVVSEFKERLGYETYLKKKEKEINGRN